MKNGAMLVIDHLAEHTGKVWCATLMPKEDHDAWKNKWAAEFYRVDFDGINVLVPHWFVGDPSAYKLERYFK